MTFKQLELIQPILKTLQEQDYQTPTPIQQQAIPIALNGKDILGVAQTGTGKTAAFGLPTIQLLEKNKSNRRAIRSLILTPTRELAIQIEESLCIYSKYTGLKQAVIFGGVSQFNQVKTLRKGADILIATPGRLLDLMTQGHVNLKSLEVFILDEADRMLDMGFLNDVKKVIKDLPEKRQTLFFSATMPPEIQKLAKNLLKDPVKIEITPESSTVDKIEQTIYFTNKPDKKKLLLHLLDEKNIPTALVFTRTKHGADKVVKFLNRSKIKSGAIHGNKSQNARQRVLKEFKKGDLKVLVATDIAARGIDIDELSHVFNYDLPNVPETYVHRIGRTGRAGNDGIAIAFCDAEEKSDLRNIEKLTSKRLEVVEGHPFPLDPSLSANKPVPPKRNSQRRRRF